MAQIKHYTCTQAHTCVCMFNACKTSKTGVCMHCCSQFWHAHVAGEHTRHARDGYCEITLGLPHYTCGGVATGTVAVGSEIQLFCG